MLRSLGPSVRLITVVRLPSSASVVPDRTKVIYSESFLDKAERMKLWNKENKLLFGALLETRKVKAKRLSQEIRPKVARSYNTQVINTSNKSVLSNSNYGKTINRTFTTERIFGVERNVSFPETITKKMSTLTCDSSKLYKINSNDSIFTKSNFGVPSIIARNLKTFPLLCNQKIGIHKNQEILSEDGVLRITSSGTEYMNFPSVSKILDQTMSEESRAVLEKWKENKIKELGPEGFEKFYKAQLEAGKRFHSLLSEYMLSNDISDVDNSLEGVWNSVSNILKQVTLPKAVESHVIHPVLKYKGIIDCIAMYQDRPTLIEWKKSDKPKPTLSTTYDNPVQLAAYFGAISHDINYKQLNVRDAILVIAYTDGTPADIFHLNTEQIRQHWATWLTRLEKFWTLNENKNDTKRVSNEKT